jgi:hypothetical protein
MDTTTRWGGSCTLGVVSHPLRTATTLRTALIIPTTSETPMIIIPPIALHPAERSTPFNINPKLGTNCKKFNKLINIVHPKKFIIID